MMKKITIQDCAQWARTRAASAASLASATLFCAPPWKRRKRMPLAETSTPFARIGPAFQHMLWTPV